MPVAEKASLAADLAVICHGGAETAVDPANVPAPADPADHSKTCPICKGLVGFQFVVLAAAELGLLEPPSGTLEFKPGGDRLYTRHVTTPRSRGPPVSV